MAEKLRVAVVGVGYGEVHVANFAARPDVEVVAVVASRRERAEAIGERYGVPLRTTDLAEALALDDLDAISITSPPNVHLEMTQAAAERKVHVLCEKPLAATSAQAEGMLAAAEAAGIVHATNYDFRVVPNFLKLHRLLEEGYVGEIRQVHVRWVAPWYPPERPWTWRNDRVSAGFGVLGDQSHILDDLHWHFGPIARVSAELRTLVAERRDEAEGRLRPCDTEDAAAFVAVTAGGVQISGQVSRCSVHAGYRTIECLGTRGMLNLTMPSPGDRTSTTLTGAHDDDEAPSDLSEPAGAPAATTQDRFAQAIRDRTVEPVTSFVDGVAVVRLTEAMRESSESGRFVELPVAGSLGGRVVYG